MQKTGLHLKELSCGHFHENAKLMFSIFVVWWSVASVQFYVLFSLDLLECDFGAWWTMDHVFPGV